MNNQIAMANLLDHASVYTGTPGELRPRAIAHRSRLRPQDEPGLTDRNLPGRGVPLGPAAFVFSEHVCR